VLTPVIAVHAGWRYPFVFAAALSLLGALAWLAVDPSRHLQSRTTPSFL
jgi:MFS transporter, ACS family, glucarate transporter